MTKKTWVLFALLLVPACGGEEPADTELLPDAMIEEDEQPDAEPAPEAVCGDGVIAGDELCDGADLGGSDCAAIGYGAGTLHCRADCLAWDPTDCAAPSFERSVTMELAIPDDTYDGSIESMTCVDVDTGALPPMYVQMAWLETTLGIDHPYLGDLVVKLIPPGGAPQTLLHRPGLVETLDDGAGSGGSGANLASGSPITLQDASGGPLAETMGAGLSGSQTACLSDAKCTYKVAPAPGTFQSQTIAAEGTWRVCVGDAGPGDTGTLRSVRLGFEALATVPPDIYRDTEISSFDLDQLYDGTLATMNCGSATFPEGTTEIGDVEVGVMVQHPEAGDLTIALVDPDGKAYGFLSRPGTAEDASGQAIDPGAAADVSGQEPYYFGIGRYRDQPLAETLGDGLADGDSVCNANCAWIADRGTSGLAAPVELIGRPIAGTWQVCFGDSTTADTGSLVNAARIVFTPTE